MSAKVAFSTNALADLRAIIDYTSIDNGQKDRSFVRELNSRIVKKLSVFPDTGVTIGDFRYVAFCSHVAIYSYDAPRRTVTIMMVTEGHKNRCQQFEEHD